MARFARSLLLFFIALVVGAVLFISSTKTNPISPVYSGAAWNGEQESVSTLAHAEPTETPSPNSVCDLGADVVRSDEPGVQSQPRPTAVTSETTVKPVAPVSIHLVTVMFTSTSNETKVQLRQQEHATVLQRNLNHSLINSVHIMTASKVELEEYLRGLNLPNRRKVVVVESKQWVTMRGVFQYISDNLVGKDVMYANGDIYLGNGFEKVDANVLSSRNIFYALTRRGKQEEACKMKDYCGGDFQYMGSHDVFLFHLKEPLPEEVLKVLDYRITDCGTENVLIGVFNKLLHYCTLNPCKILESYHFHCSGAHRSDRVRVNTNPKFNGLSPFTSNLIC